MALEIVQEGHPVGFEPRWTSEAPAEQEAVVDVASAGVGSARPTGGKARTGITSKSDRHPSPVMGIAAVPRRRADDGSAEIAVVAGGRAPKGSYRPEADDFLVSVMRLSGRLFCVRDQRPKSLQRKFGSNFLGEFVVDIE